MVKIRLLHHVVEDSEQFVCFEDLDASSLERSKSEKNIKILNHISAAKIGYSGNPWCCGYQRGRASEKD